MTTTIRFYRNSAPGAPRFRVTRLPVRQTLVWLGPLFILIQPRQEVK